MSSNSENRPYQVNLDLPPPTPIASPPRGDDQSGLILDIPMTPYIGNQAATEDDIIADEQAAHEQPPNVAVTAGGGSTNVPQAHVNVQPPLQQQPFQNLPASQYNETTSMPPPTFPTMANSHRYRAPRPPVNNTTIYQPQNMMMPPPPSTHSFLPAANAHRYRNPAPRSHAIGANQRFLGTAAISPPLQSGPISGQYGPPPRMRGMVPMQRAQAIRPGFQTNPHGVAAQSTAQFFNPAATVHSSYTTSSLPSQYNNPYHQGITTAQRFPVGPPQHPHVYPNIQPALSQPHPSTQPPPYVMPQMANSGINNNPTNSTLTAGAPPPQIQSTAGSSAVNFNPRYVNCMNSVPISQPAASATSLTQLAAVGQTVQSRIQNVIVTELQRPNNAQVNTNPMVTQTHGLESRNNAQTSMTAESVPPENVQVVHQEGRNPTQIQREIIETFLKSFKAKKTKIINEYPLLAGDAPNATKECQNFMKTYNRLEEKVNNLFTMLHLPGMYLSLCVTVGQKI